MQQVLKTYLNRLINLKGNNRSIFLSRLSKSQDLDLQNLDFSLNEGAFHIIEKLIAGQKKIEICKHIDSRDAQSNVQSTQLKKIQRKYKFIVEERGAKDLFVAWPFVEGKLMDNTVIRCPLLFFPVELELNKKNVWELSLRKDETPTFNKNFLLAYSFFNQTVLNEELLEETFEDFGADATVFKTNLYELLKNQNLELNFNSDLFANQLKKYIDISKHDFENTRKTGMLKLMPNAVLGIFQQHTSFLFPDYQELLDQGKIESISNFFESKHIILDKYKKDMLIREHYTYNAFPMDAHQEKVLSQIKQGKSLVVQGPPGTGKSQLICNIVTDFLARGKKILIVCQKKAALDVVYNRLKEKDLEHFSGLIHDFKSDRKDLYEKIGLQIDNIEKYQIRNSRLDTVFQERKFFELSNSISAITSEFDEFKDALFDQKECGKSVKELYLTTNKNLPFIDFNQYYAHFKEENKKEFLRKLKAYLLYAGDFEQVDYPLHDRVSFAHFSYSDQNRLIEKMETVVKTQIQFKSQLKEWLVDSFDLGEIEWVLERKGLFQELKLKLANDETYAQFVEYTSVKTDITKFRQAADRLNQVFDGEGIETSLKNDELGAFHSLLQKSLANRKNPVKWMFWKLFSKDRYWIKRVLVANQLDLDKDDLGLLEQKIEARMNLEHNITALKGMDFISKIPQKRDQKSIRKYLLLHDKALEAKEIYSTLRSFKEFFRFGDYNRLSFENTVDLLFEYIEGIKTEMNQWSEYLSPSQIQQLLGHPEYLDTIRPILDRDFDSLCEYDKIVSELEPIEVQIIDKIKEKSEDYSEETWLPLFENSLGISWIEHIEIKYPILRSASTRKFTQMEKDLQASVLEKQELSKEIMLLKAREVTYNNVEYNRLKNMTTYRQLGNQVNKKRRIWPIRKLVQQYSDELMDLIPCWLCSPETASAVFPLEEVFDIVIFDEASQCYSEKSIPAVARGKQVLIVGDSNQLAPNDLYQVRWEELDTDDQPDLEAESVLDLASFYLDTISLKQHYRSRSLELIDFSNKHFYNSNLQLIPDFRDINEKPPGINYIKVNGIWEQSTNPIEAKKVIEIVLDFISKGISDLGVVTFNFQQQQLILDLLEQTAIEKNILIPESVFVKNIENVQGDERDHIIFSIGYAKDQGGKLRMHFGSLNMQKGENRLNVAITRARESITLVSSISPVELKVDQTANDGPKLLKKYLEYAFDVSNGNYIPTPFTSLKIASDYFLKTVIQSESESLNPELPFADLTEKATDKDGGTKYKSLIFTDDDLYYENISAKETHAYIPIFLQSKHWKFKRTYTRDWWKNRTN